MSPTPQSPRISSLAWGHVEVDGSRSFKDAMLFPGGAREWDWKETGTSHSLGVQVADVEELLENGAEVVVIACGVFQRLKGPPEIYRTLEERGVAVHVLRTKDAVRRYNELRETEAAGGLFHTTC